MYLLIKLSLLKVRSPSRCTMNPKLIESAQGGSYMGVTPSPWLSYGVFPASAFYPHGFVQTPNKFSVNQEGVSTARPAHQTIHQSSTNIHAVSQPVASPTPQGFTQQDTRSFNSSYQAFPMARSTPQDSLPRRVNNFNGTERPIPVPASRGILKNNRTQSSSPAAVPPRNNRQQTAPHSGTHHINSSHSMQSGAPHSNVGDMSGNNGHVRQRPNTRPKVNFSIGEDSNPRFGHRTSAASDICSDSRASPANGNGNGQSSCTSAERMSPLTALTRVNTQHNTIALKTMQDSTNFQIQQMFPGNPPSFSKQLMARAKAARISFDVYRHNGVIDEYALENALCPEWENCAISLLGIHRQANCLDIIGLIHEGDVVQLRNFEGVFNAPRWDVAFKTRAEAERLRQRANRREISFRDNFIQAEWSDNKVAPRHPWEMNYTRILDVIGPIDHEFSSARKIENFLRKEVQGQPFYFISKELALSNGRQRVVRLEFLRVHGQACNAFKYIFYRICKMGIQHQFQVRFAADPCNKM